MPPLTRLSNPTLGFPRASSHLKLHLNGQILLGLGHKSNLSTPFPAMASDAENRDETPPRKRRRTESESPSRNGSGSHDHADWKRSGGDDDDARGNRPLSRTSSERGSRRRYYSGSEASSRSRSRSRSRRRDHASRSRSRRRSPSRSRYDSRSRSRSRSSDRSPSQYFSPPAVQPTPPPLRRELLKPNYRPRRVLRGHEGAVSQVRISPNGRLIATASSDGTIKVWDAATGSHMDTLVGHMAGVSCVAWSPDSNTLASGSDDKAIRLWDKVTGRPKTTTRKSMVGQEMAPLRGHHNYIHCLAFSPKGNILASGSYDEVVFLWDVRAGRLMRSLPAHSDPVSGIDFCSDGTLVVSCSTDGLM